MASDAKGQTRIFEKELDRIRMRRNIACPKDEGHETPSGNETTGLALSGGGVRSAAFSLGFLQELYRTGRMKGVDFLSTVSGGGYAGAFFSSQVVNQDKVNWDDVNCAKVHHGDEGKPDRLNLEPNRDGTPSESVSRVEKHGRLIGNFLELFSRHLWGCIVNVVFIVSGLIAIAALLAYFMRTLWDPSTNDGEWVLGAMDVTKELGFRTDLTRPFFFVFITLCIWILSHCFNWGAKALGKRPLTVIRYTYLMLIASVVLAVLTLLAISDVEVTNWIDDFNLDPALNNRINAVTHWMATGLSAIFAMMLLPYLSLKRLLQSGQANAGNVKSLIFQLAGNAALIGVPLFLFFFLAHENISGETAKVDQLAHPHLSLVAQWTRSLESQTLDESQVKKELGHRLLSALNGKNEWERSQSDEIPNRENAHEDYLRADSKLDELEVDLNLARRWEHYFESYFHSDCVYEDRMKCRKNIRTAKDSMTENLNKLCLSDPALFVTLATEVDSVENQATAANETRPVVEASVGDKTSMAGKDALVGSVDPAHQSWSQYFNVLTLLRWLPLDDERPKTKRRVAETITNTEAVENNNASTLVSQKLESKPTAASKVARDTKTPEILLALGLIAETSDAGNESSSQRRKELMTAMDDLQTRKQRLEKRFAVNVTSDFSDLNNDNAYLALCYFVLDEELNLQPRSPQDRDALVTDQASKQAYRRGELNGRALTAMENFFKDESSAISAIDKEIKKLKLDDGVKELDHEKFLNWFNKESIAFREQLAGIRKNNWSLLSAVYPSNIRPQDTTFAGVVNIADQKKRLRIAIWAMFIFLVVGLLSNLNSTSLHGVYRDQLASIWTPDDQMKLSDLNTCCKGAPYHIINATVNRMGNRNDADPEGRSRFLLSELFCGTFKLGYRETDDYQDDELAVTDAVAISGAAVTTISTGNFLQQMILFITNCRLGQWLRNPNNHRVDRYWPSPIRALGSLLLYPDQRSFLFLSDGGHLDNTGISALLERRCGLIVCLDGSYDPNGEFTDLMKVLHAARGKYGLTIRPVSTGSNGGQVKVGDPLSGLRAIVKEGNPTFSKDHFVTFEIEYPETDKEGNPLKAVLVYCKLSVTGDEPLELTEMTRAKKTFPFDPTSDQFMSAEVFEAYTALGRHIAKQVDTFFKGESLQAYDLPLCWNQQPEGNDKEPSNNSSINHVEEVVPDDCKLDPHEFDDKQFDKEAITNAINGLKSWCKKELGNPADSINDDYLIAMSSWGRVFGENADQPLRKQFCVGLSEMIDLYEDKLTQLPIVQAEFLKMLGLLNKGISKTRKAMKKLASAGIVRATQDPN